MQKSWGWVPLRKQKIMDSEMKVTVDEVGTFSQVTGRSWLSFMLSAWASSPFPIPFVPQPEPEPEPWHNLISRTT